MLHQFPCHSGGNLYCPQVGIPVYLWQGLLGYDLKIAPLSLSVLYANYF